MIQHAIMAGKALESPVPAIMFFGAVKLVGEKRKMNKQRRKKIEKFFRMIDMALEVIQGAMDEEQEAYDNLPENFQNGERGEEMAGYIEILDETIGYLEEAKSAVEQI